MQATVRLHPKSQFQNPWRDRDHHFQQLQLLDWNLKSKKFELFAAHSRGISSKSLKFSCGLGCRNFEEEKSSIHLPVIIRRAGTASQYIWDGKRLKMVRFDQEELNYIGFGGFCRSLRSWIQMLRSVVRNLFIPQQVQNNYMYYLRWKLLHRVFSSALQVLATQAMFRAIGIGSSRSLTSAAALNWVLKDGLGRLSRCIYTASLGSAFDTNLKRVRFLTSVLFSLSIGVELLTPSFPQYFLLLATIANNAKSISLAAYLATSSAIHRSFAIADNLGEVSAKGQIQTVCFDNLGLMLAAIMNILFKNSQRRLQASLPLVVYPVFSAVDLFAIYQGLKHVHLQTLTKDRLEIIIDAWIHSGCVPSIAEVANKEDINFLGSKGSKLWPIRIGCVDPKEPSPMLSVTTMQSLRGGDLYFISMETSYTGLLTRKKKQGMLLSLHERAVTADIIKGLMQACYLRNVLLQRKTGTLPAQNGKPLYTGSPQCIIRGWFSMVDDSEKFVGREVSLFIQEMRKSGWAVKNVLLNSREQIRYSIVEEYPNPSLKLKI